jgi:hypothetical protein
MDKNRELCELLGICWHEPIATPDGESIRCICGKIHWWRGYPDHPDFTTDAGKVMLLREMRKQEDWKKFYNSLHWSTFAEDYILDTTGLLRDKAIAFLKERQATNEPR